MLALLLLSALDPYPETKKILADLIPMATVSELEDPKTSPHYLAMRQYLEAFAKKEGLSFEAFGDNGVFEIGWGQGDPVLAFVVHGDVVPAPRQEWSVDPFVLTEKDGKLYGRGTEDDKAALASVLTLMKQHKAAGFRPKGKVLCIIGMGEEHDWDGIKAYVKRFEKKAPTHTVSIDSGYPVTANEFGFVSWTLAFGAAKKPGTLTIDALEAGLFLTQVPGSAKLVVRGKDALTIVQKAAETFKRDGLGLAIAEDAGKVVITTSGKAVHSSSADSGVNALTGLGAFAATLPLAPSSDTSVLQALAQFFDGEHWGEKLGLAYADKDMGKLLVIPTLVRKDKTGTTLGINMRRPAGKTNAEFAALLETTRARIAQTLGATVSVSGETYIGEPHVARISPTVPVLLDIYARVMQVKDPKAETIRGGTYARLFPGSVNFGPSFPDDPYMGHAPDEYIRVDRLKATLAMLSQAIERLAR